MCIGICTDSRSGSPRYMPVVLDTTFRLALIYMLKTKKIGKIIDVVTAFLYGDLEENIYMKVSEGFKERLKKEFKNNCAIMRKAAYGLVQAARQYYKKFVRILTKEMGFEKCMANQCLLKREDESGVVVICIYVDDTLCIGDREALEKFTNQITEYLKKVHWTNTLVAN